MAKFEREGIYKGLKVLDFTIALAGVFNAWQYADNGADVWKVEKYGSGDQARLWGPFVDDFSVYYASFNRNKRSIEIDMRNPEGKALILELVKHCDLVLENFKAGTLEKLGLGYEEMAKVNPKVVYASLSGFGTSGPLWKLPCYDIIACARGGLLATSGEADGMPIKPGFSIGDNMTGINFHHATNMALYQARKTGKGCRLEIAMMDTCMQAIDTAIVENSLTGSYQMRSGDHDRFFAPYGIYEARDGYVAIAVSKEEEWTRFCDAMGAPKWKEDPRFANNQLRLENLEALVKEITALTRNMWRADFEKAMRAAHVPGVSVDTFEEAISSPQIHQTDTLVYVQQSNFPAVGRLPMINVPVHFSKTPGAVKQCSPMLGEDTVDILRENGLSDERIQALLDQKAVGVYQG